jgi:uncharacterized protein (TIGR03382 family)
VGTAVLALGLISGGCGQREAASEAVAPGVSSAPVVYGVDDRIEWYEVADAGLKSSLRDAVAVMVDWSYVSTDEVGHVVLDGDPALGPLEGLCADQRFWSQPTAGMCSGTLIADDLLLTAGHCVPSLADCASSAWVFDYLYEADGQLAELGDDDVYGCVDVIVRPDVDVTGAIDLAIIQLDRPVTGRAPAAVATRGSVARGEPLIMAGFPSGIPLKVDQGATVVAPRSQTADYFVASLDSFHGNSGSMVMNAGHRIVGVLVNGADDYVNAGSCNVVSVLAPDAAEEEAVYAFHGVEALCRRAYPSATLCADAAEPTCGDGFCTQGETRVSCPGDCQGLFAVPEAWSCNPGFYGQGDGCDCDCGARDPDCDAANQEVYNCAPGSACERDGSCAVPIPAGWACDPSRFGDGQRCDCACGAPDPDCSNPRNQTSGCAPGGACQADGTCTIPIPEGWSCRRRYYGSGDGCDCNCGAPDPDCANPAQVVSGCAPGSACLADGTCENPIPSGWICPVTRYGRGNECDCNCGAYDPDCAVRGARVLNCGAGGACAADGTCEEATADPGPEVVEPGPEVVEEVPDVVEADPDTAEPADAEADTAADTNEVSDADTHEVSESDTHVAEPDTTDTAETEKVLARGAGGCEAGGGGGWAAAGIVLLLGLQRRRRAGADSHEA